MNGNPFGEDSINHSSGNNGLFSFSDFGIGGAGIEIVSASDKLGMFSTNKFKLKSEQFARISLLNEQFFKISTHWTRGSGYFLCTHGQCCEKLGNALPKRYAAVVVYKNVDSRGNIVGNTVDWDIQIIQLGNKNYQAFDIATSQIGQVSGYDIIVKCADEKFQSYNFVAVPRAAAWMVPEVRAEIQKRLEREGAHLLDCVGKRLSEDAIAEYIEKEMMERAANGVDQPMKQGNPMSPAFAAQTSSFASQASPLQLSSNASSEEIVF